MDWHLKPARDLGLAGAERLRSPVRERGRPGLAVNAAWRSLVLSYLRLAHRLTIEGAENLPRAAPFIIIANHTSHLDALTLGAALRGSPAFRAYSLAAGDTFFTSNAASLFAANAINALPVWRGTGSPAAMLTFRERLIEDRLVFILFPEGSRSRTGEIARFRHGIGVLAAGSEIPVVPCHLTGAFAAWPATSRFPRPRKLHLRIGKPLQFPDTANDETGWREVAAACEAAVRALR
jgi:1-acyl-sn-glycerol-3-phosphate acyltransferase